MEGCNVISALIDSAMKVNQERRRSTRVPLKARVTLGVKDRTVAGELVNISLHGALVVPADPIELHALVTFTIADTERGPGIVDVKAKVVRVTEEGIGLEFLKES